MTRRFTKYPSNYVQATYTVKNFKTKKALKEAVENGEAVEIYEPGFGEPVANGVVYLEGPHYPEPHRWYAQALVRDGLVVKVKYL